MMKILDKKLFVRKIPHHRIDLEIWEITDLGKDIIFNNKSFSPPSDNIISEISENIKKL